MTQDQRDALDRAQTRALRAVKHKTDSIKKTCGPFAAAQAADLQAEFEADFKKNFELLPDVAQQPPNPPPPN